MNISEIAGQVHTLSGAPPLDGGREGHLYALIFATLRKLYLKAKLSDQNLLVQTYSNWTPSSNDVELPEQNITPTSVSLIYDETNDYRQMVRIVDLNEIDRYRREGQLGVAFWGHPQRARFTWNPADDSDALVLYYEPVQADPTATTSTPKIPADHHDLIAVETAILFREAVLNVDVPQSLVADRRERMELFDKWCKGDREQRVIRRASYTEARGGYYS
jgi:hypothetical protein